MSSKRVLLVNAPTDFAQSVLPLLSRRGFEVDRLRSSPAALELVSRARLDLVGFGMPVEEPPLQDYLKAVRKEGAPSRGASVILIGGPDDCPDAEVSAGANRRIAWPRPPVEAVQLFARLLDIAPRQRIRLMTRLDVILESGRKKFLCQSENVSATGMLLALEKPIPLGAYVSIELTLPSDPDALSLTARVVREARSGRKVCAIGVHFEDFLGSSRERLERFLATKLQEESGSWLRV